MEKENWDENRNGNPSILILNCEGKTGARVGDRENKPREEYKGRITNSADPTAAGDKDELGWQNDQGGGC